MTGYGKSICEFDNKLVTIEIKSLNGKQSDVYTRLPNLYREKDLDIRAMITNIAKRGKIECILTVDFQEEGQAAIINKPVIKEYYAQITGIRKELDAPESETLLQSILRLPESLKTEKEELTETEWDIIKNTLSQALDQFDIYRIQEGKSLEKDILQHIGQIEKLLLNIEGFEKNRIIKIKKRIRSNLNEFFEKEIINKTRFEQELIYYLEKLDITEEKVRLQNHCNYFRKVVEENEQIGKKLNFISQELGREINTIGSKANDFDIQKLVVLMKDELEKIKEQLMNIL